ncbi:MAG: PD-(D/E)XK nuclease family protein, partial [Pseudomonadota bacterium]
TNATVKILGALEARVQAAELVILGGLNEGSWPEAARPDPWLNRRLLAEVGLLLPDRDIGLSAHDYQQAVCAPEVWLTRAIRSGDSETIPSRWINRLRNLMPGIPDGSTELKEMAHRAERYIRLAELIDDPKAEPCPAPRPSPAPPVDARPKTLSITQIKTLIRDPYAVYAREVLNLRRLEPLRRDADAALRGTILHKVLEVFSRQGSVRSLEEGKEQLLRAAELVMQADVPWPTARRFWLARVRRLASDFVQTELDRQGAQSLAGVEVSAHFPMPELAFTLTGKADRIDLTPEGTAIIYDYKTGRVPTPTQQLLFDKQLIISAILAERGAFAGIGMVPVAEAKFIGLGTNTIREVPAPLDDRSVWPRFVGLIRRYFQESQGFTARRAMLSDDDLSTFDALSRYGEWDLSQAPRKEAVR